MTTVTKKSRTIIYKKAVTQGARSTKTLQTMLEDALFNTQSSSREESANGKKRLINSCISRTGMLFGQMIVYNEGASQSLLTKSDHDTHYDIEEIRANQVHSEKQGNKEFVESTLYFGVYENHVVVMQSQALNAKTLESHFDWLLHDCCSILAIDEMVVLQDKVTLEAKEKIEQSGTKNIKLGAPVRFKQEVDSQQTKRWRAATKGAKIIRHVVGREKWDSFNLNHSLDEENIVVELTIKYNRKTTEHGQEVLDEIATALRHQESDDYRIELKDGAIIKGGELKISTHIDVNFDENGRVVETELYSEMRRWILDNLEKEYI